MRALQRCLPAGLLTALVALTGCGASVDEMDDGEYGSTSAALTRDFATGIKSLWSHDYTPDCVATPGDPPGGKTIGGGMTIGGGPTICLKQDPKQRIQLKLYTAGNNPTSLYTIDNKTIDTSQTWYVNAIGVAGPLVLSRGTSWLLGYQGNLSVLDAAGNISNRRDFGWQKDFIPTGISETKVRSSSYYTVFWTPVQNTSGGSVRVTVHNSQGNQLGDYRVANRPGLELRSVVKDDDGVYHMLWANDSGRAVLEHGNFCQSFSPEGVCVDWQILSWTRTQTYRRSGWTARNLTLQQTTDYSGTPRRYMMLFWGEVSGNHGNLWTLDSQDRWCGDPELTPAEVCPPYWKTPATQSWVNTPFVAKGLFIEGTVE